MNDEAVAVAKRIVEEMKAEGLNKGRLTMNEFYREFANRNAIADLRRQASDLGESFADRDLQRGVMDDGTVVLCVEIAGGRLLSAYKVENDAITFTVPLAAEIDAMTNEERPRWLH